MLLQKACSKCNVIKSLSDFHKSTRSKDGVQPACKQCMNVAYNASRKKKQSHYQAVARQRRNQTQQRVSEWKSERGCACCGETCSPCLELHHPDPSVKEDNPSNLVAVSFEAFLTEAEKCVVLCANCHRKVHAGYLTLTTSV